MSWTAGGTTTPSASLSGADHTLEAHAPCSLTLVRYPQLCASVPSYSTCLCPLPQLQAFESRAGDQDLYFASSPHWRDPKLRVAAKQLAAPGPGQASDACPAAHFIGIDAAPDPGLRGPLNFLGHLPSGALLDLEAELRAAAE